MAREILGIAGAAVGSMFGPVGASIGFTIGSAIGGIIDPQYVDGPSLGDAPVQTSRDGIPIPIGWGITHVVGNIIQVNPIVETTKKSGGKKGGVKQKIRKRTFAIGIGRGIDGPIAGIKRVWENNKLIYDGRDGSTFPAKDNTAFLDSVSIYLGTEAQLPDSELESDSGVGTTPAYRGLAYIVFNNKNLTDFGSSIPSYRFEIDAGQNFFGYNPIYMLAEGGPSAGVYKFSYFSIDTELKTLTLITDSPGSSGGSYYPNVVSDGTYVLRCNGANDLEVLSFDGSVFTQETSLINADYNDIDFLNGRDGVWISAGSGSASRGVTVGSWSDTAIARSGTTKWVTDLSEGVLDFRMTSDAQGEFDGYGKLYTAMTYGPTPQDIASFTTDGAGAPVIISKVTKISNHVRAWGWDRATGQMITYNGNNYYYFTIDLDTGVLTKVGTIVIASAGTPTFKHGFLIIGGRTMRSYSISGTTAALVDEWVAPSFVSVGQIHNCPYSAWMFMHLGGGNILVFKIDDTGMFDTTNSFVVADGGVQWPGYYSGLHTMNAPLNAT